MHSLTRVFVIILSFLVSIGQFQIIQASGKGGGKAVGQTNANKRKQGGGEEKGQEEKKRKVEQEDEESEQEEEEGEQEQEESKQKKEEEEEKKEEEEEKKETKEQKKEEEEEKGNSNTAQTLTAIAISEEATKRYYKSPVGLIYRGAKAVNLGERVLHITHHLADDTSREIHNYFHTTSPAYSDVIAFIDLIFKEINDNQYYRNIQTDNEKNRNLGRIKLNGLDYEVLCSLTAGTYVFNIRSLRNSSASYPITGIRGGSNNPGTTTINSYRASFGYTLKQSSPQYEIWSFYPSDGADD